MQGYDSINKLFYFFYLYFSFYCFFAKNVNTNANSTTTPRSLRYQVWYFRIILRCSPSLASTPRAKYGGKVGGGGNQKDRFDHNEIKCQSASVPGLRCKLQRLNPCSEPCSTTSRIPFCLAFRGGGCISVGIELSPTEEKLNIFRGFLKRLETCGSTFNFI